MKRRTLLSAAAASALTAMLFGAPVFAGDGHNHGHGHDKLTIENAAARPGLPNRPMAAYMRIKNGGHQGDRLVSASSPDFETIELHTVKEKDGVMTMLPVEGYDVPAHGMVMLEPGGNHLMLFGAARSFKTGDSFSVTLTFEKAGEVTIEVSVKKITGKMHDHKHNGHSGHGTTN